MAYTLLRDDIRSRSAELILYSIIEYCSLRNFIAILAI